MKKVLALTALTASLFGMAAQAETIRFGIDGNYPPFAKQGPDGKLQGFDVDIAYALCGAMKVTCQIVPQDWDGLIPALNANKFDAILSSMSITDERKKAVDFSNKYYHTPSRMIAKEGLKVDQNAFKGKKIGALRASTQERFAKDYWGKAGASVVSYGKTPEAFLDLRSGRIDGVFVDATVGELDFLKTPQGKGFAFVGPDYNEAKYFGYGAGIAVKKGNAALVSRLNQAIDQIRKDGTYKKVQDKYFTFDVYGK
ncbi:MULTISPECIES: ABC transporter substrate-binding protein [Gulbenkiania]|uniref:Lysine-arginine-ornithine-binding periplasmic protein n=1 Tax=Gulbenkiania indica TaxID=375574 RepID=A0A0K6H3Q8_9NEIS|nr:MULTISPECIES: ABC transporter substrate-binding protein [Gulbenkiania]CUA85540.1 lysine-arginine-ornithine-binding periplasmic protein [Gulbenkiania indica]